MAECCRIDAAPSKAPAISLCPECRSRSKRVDILTVKSLVRHLPFQMPQAQYYFCEAPRCQVVYFPLPPQAPLFRQEDLLVPVGQKAGSGPLPICYCFGVTRNDIWEEVGKTGSSSLIEQIRAEVKARNCACEVKNPSGKCCLGNAVRAAHEAGG